MSLDFLLTTAGPSASTAVLVNNTFSTLSFTRPVASKYIVQLIVSNGMQNNIPLSNGLFLISTKNYHAF
jgi:hypothetical protein